MAKTIAQIERQRRAKQDVVEVGRGELVPVDVYRALSREDKARLKELGIEAFSVEREAKRQAKFEKESIQLSSGEPVSRSDFEALSVANQELLMELGLDAFNELLEEQKKEIAPYLEEGTEHEYNLDAMLDAGYTAEQIVAFGFDAEGVADLLERRATLAPYKGEDGYALGDMLDAGFTQQQLVDLGFEETEVVKAISQREELAPYKTEEGYAIGDMLDAGYTKAQLVDFGFDATDVDATIARREELAPYKSVDAEGNAQYDISGMLDAGFTKQQLVDLGFEAADVDKLISNRETLAQYKTGEDQYDLSKMMDDGFTDSQLVELGFDQSTVTMLRERDTVLAQYETEEGYNLVQMLQDGYTVPQLRDWGFSKDDVRQAHVYIIALEQLAPYQTESGGYDLVAIAEAMEKNQLSQDLVDLILGSYTEQYLTVAQVHQLRLAPYGQAKLLADAWGISVEQLDQIRAAPTDVAAQVYSYLMETTPEALQLTHPSQLPSVPYPIDWEAIQQLAAYLLPDKTYDMVAAYNDTVSGDLPVEVFNAVFGPEFSSAVEEIRGSYPSAEVESYDADTGEIAFRLSSQDQFDYWRATDPNAPADAEYRGEGEDGGFTYFSYSTAEIEIETADGKKTMKLSEWDKMSEIKRYELILGRAPTLNEWIGYCVMREDVAFNFSILGFPGLRELQAAIATFIPGEQKEEAWARVAQAAQREWNDTYPEMKWVGSLVALPMEKMGIAAAKAIYPQIKVTDITGREWAETGLAVALWTMPIWLPKIIAGIKIAIPKVTSLFRTIHARQTGGVATGR